MQSTVKGTTLNLLTREGSVAVTFPVELTEAQYAKLYECVSECDTKCNNCPHRFQTTEVPAPDGPVLVPAPNALKP